MEGRLSRYIRHTLRLSGSVCAYHPATRGSSSKLNLNAILIYAIYLLIDMGCENNEIKQ